MNRKQALLVGLAVAIAFLIALVGWCLPRPGFAPALEPTSTPTGLEFSWVPRPPVAVAGPHFLPTPTAGEGSLPWTGSTVGDAGPYSADTWADAWALFFTYDKNTEGVIVTDDTDFDGLLAVTNSPTTTLTITDGAAIVDGNLYYLLGSVTITDSLSAPGAGTDYYRVVLRKDRTAQTVRVTLLGPVNGSWPSLTQSDTGDWELPLYKLTVTNGGTFTLLDDRNYALRPQQRSVLYPAFTGRNSTDGVDIARGSSSLGVSLAASKNCQVTYSFVVPEDYASDMTVKAVLIPNGASGNAYLYFKYYHAQCGEAYNTHSDITAWATYAVTDGYDNCVGSTALTTLEPGDIVHGTVGRNATSASDTISTTNIYMAGWLMEYTPKY